MLSKTVNLFLETGPRDWKWVTVRVGTHLTSVVVEE